MILVLYGNSGCKCAAVEKFRRISRLDGSAVPNNVVAHKTALQLLSRVTGVDEVQLLPEMLLDQLRGWDSFAMLEIQMAFDEELGVDLDPQQVGACRTVKELLEAVQASRIANDPSGREV